MFLILLYTLIDNFFLASFVKGVSKATALVEQEKPKMSDIPNDVHETLLELIGKIVKYIKKPEFVELLSFLFSNSISLLCRQYSTSQVKTLRTFMQKSLSFTLLSITSDNCLYSAIDTLGRFFPDRFDKFLTPTELSDKKNQVERKFVPPRNLVNMMEEISDTFYTGCGFLIDLVSTLVAHNFHNTISDKLQEIKQGEGQWWTRFTYRHGLQLLKVLRMVCFPFFLWILIYLFIF